MLRCVSPPPTFVGELSTEHGPTRRLWLRLGTRIGLGTAANDHQALRLTGLLSLARSSLKGAGFHLLLFLLLKAVLVFVFSVLHFTRFNQAANGPDKPGQFPA